MNLPHGAPSFGSLFYFTIPIKFAHNYTDQNSIYSLEHSLAIQIHGSPSFEKEFFYTTQHLTFRNSSCNSVKVSSYS